MAQDGYLRRFSAHAFLFSVSLGLVPASAFAAGVKDALSGIDTGPYADAACRAGIEALVGTVDGLGAAQLSNLTLDGNVISGDLTLPIGGSWKLNLFAPNCEKKAFALLRPASDLKLSEMVSSVPGLAEVDKLGLTNQAFVLSNTEGEMASGDVPTSVATILTAANGGNSNFNVAVKPGLTVLGVVDLSKSTLTSKALSFIGFKGSDSKKILVSGLLGQSMLAAMVSGSKPKPDFSLTGAFRGLTLSLPGGYTLPTAALSFSTTINGDGKAFNMQVAVESEWKSALGIPGLNLANVAIDINAGDDTSASLSAATTIGGQALNVSWSAAKAETTEVVVRLAAPAGKSFKIGSLAGLSSVPLIN
jgi:hypothetical protein